jgi:hypothetical protein
MKYAPQIYVLTLDSSARKALRLWKGANIHALRHCSVKQISSALMEMQQRLETLQQTKIAVTSSESYSLNRAR